MLYQSARDAEGVCPARHNWRLCLRLALVLISACSDASYDGVLGSGLGPEERLGC